MKYTAAQLRLLNEAEWGWASRGEDPPPPPEPKPPRKKLTRRELMARQKQRKAMWRRARHSDVADELLDKQRKANIKRQEREAEAGRGEVPPSEASTRIDWPWK
jgi:hypothetical protein